MGKTNAAIVQGGERATAKAPKITQAQINIIEGRLSLPGGTTPKEVGAKLMLKYGKAEEKRVFIQGLAGARTARLEAIRYARIEGNPMPFPPELSEAEFKEDLGRFLGKEPRVHGAKILGTALIKKTSDEISLQRKKEIADFTELTLAYITSTYGGEKRDPIGKLIGYGDRIEVRKNGHIHKLW